MVRREGCPFCDIVAGDGRALVVARGRGVTAFFPDEPATRGHTLVVPDDHIGNLWDLDQGKARNLATEVLRVANAVRETLSPQGLNIIQSNGAVASQTVDHLHVHVLPRWEGDAVGDIWPKSPALDPGYLEEARASIAAAVETADSPGYDLSDPQDREDRRKHLDLVSAVIARLAGSSALAKGWAVTLAGAAFGVALARESWPLIAVGILVLVAFALLDARYLEAERRAIAVYTGLVESNSIAPFSMQGLATSSTKSRCWPSRFRSWSIWYFYVPLVLGGAGLLLFAALNFGDGEVKDGRGPRTHDQGSQTGHHLSPQTGSPTSPVVSPGSTVPGSALSAPATGSE